MRKNAPFWPIIWPLWPWPWSHDLELCARTLRYSIPIYPASFAKIGWWERGEKGVTDRRTSVQLITYIHKRWNVASNQESINSVYPNSKNQFRNESQMCARPGNVLKHLLPLENPLIMDETHKYYMYKNNIVQMILTLKHNQNNPPHQNIQNR